MVLAVIPTKKLLTERASILDGPETIRKLGPLFEGLELAFRVRIVVRDMGPTVRLGDPQISQHEGHRLGGHRGCVFRSKWSGDSTGSGPGFRWEAVRIFVGNGIVDHLPESWST